ncbi:hypothetical protein E2C01_081827 [Portunus trituberculatus]|uniref:Uncharacterized protein n=1 Tax=Portunus trituberculatus TaxID=210409 RepID=A0A5B7ISW1_PORTR|nr:hypothetical protein [Portunus trituberculatus]
MSVLPQGLPLHAPGTQTRNAPLHTNASNLLYLDSR